MAITEIESGTQVSTATHTLGSGASTDGIYVCKFNLDDMVTGDTLEIGIRGGTLSTDANTDEYSGFYTNTDGGLDDPNVTSPPVIIVQGTARCFCRTIAGGSISVPWALIQVQ